MTRNLEFGILCCLTTPGLRKDIRRQIRQLYLHQVLYYVYYYYILLFNDTWSHLDIWLMNDPCQSFFYACRSENRHQVKWAVILVTVNGFLRLPQRYVRVCTGQHTHFITPHPEVCMRYLLWEFLQRGNIAVKVEDFWAIITAQ